MVVTVLMVFGVWEICGFEGVMAFGVWEICGCEGADGDWCVGNLWL